MSAQTHLAQYHVSVAQARQFIMDNLNNPGAIFNVAKQFGVTNEMLAEIVGGYSASDVKGFFSSHGFNASQLDAGSSGSAELLPSQMAALGSLVTLNTNTGGLANAALRDQIISKTSASDYNKAFDPASYNGSSDGVFSSADFGVTGLGNLPATAETVESLFFGTSIKTLKAIDMQEIQEVQNFVLTNQSTLGNQSSANYGVVLDQYIALMVDVFKDPASPPLFNDAQIADSIVLAGTAFVKLVGSGQSPALFDGLVSGFMP